MSDAHLIAFGCVVFYIAAYAVYVHVRGGFAYRDSKYSAAERAAVMTREEREA